MDYYLNSKRSFHRQKLQYQDEVIDQPAITTGTLSPSYLTTDSKWKIVTNHHFPLHTFDGQKKQVKTNSEDLIILCSLKH